MVQFFFFVIVNCFSIYENSSITNRLDGDLFRVLVFDYTVLLLDTKQIKRIRMHWKKIHRKQKSILPT